MTSYGPRGGVAAQATLIIPCDDDDDDLTILKMYIMGGLKMQGEHFCPKFEQ